MRFSPGCVCCSALSVRCDRCPGGEQPPATGYMTLSGFVDDPVFFSFKWYSTMNGESVPMTWEPTTPPATGYGEWVSDTHPDSPYEHNWKVSGTRDGYDYTFYFNIRFKCLPAVSSPTYEMTGEINFLNGSGSLLNNYAGRVLLSEDVLNDCDPAHLTFKWYEDTSYAVLEGTGLFTE